MCSALCYLAVCVSCLTLCASPCSHMLLWAPPKSHAIHRPGDAHHCQYELTRLSWQQFQAQ